MFISNKIIDEIVSYIQQEKFDVVFIEDSVFGNLVKAIKNKDMTVRVVTFYHDIKASLYPQWIKHTKWVNKIEYTVGIRQERLNSRMSDCNVACRNINLKFSLFFCGRKTCDNDIAKSNTVLFLQFPPQIVQIPFLLPLQVSGDKGAHPPVFGVNGFDAG